MVGARGFGPPTSWSQTMKSPEISNLAINIRVTNACHLLLVFNGLCNAATGTLAAESRFYAGGGHKFGHSYSQLSFLGGGLTITGSSGGLGVSFRNSSRQSSRVFAI